MAFSFKNAPAKFRNWMESVLEPIEGVHVYVDDIHIEAPDVDTLLERLEKVTENLNANKVSVNLDKLEIGREVKFLGMIRNKNGLLPDTEKIKTLKRTSLIKSPKALKRTLGLLRYLSPSIPNIERKIAQFNRLTSTKVKWKWDEVKQRKLEEIINEVSEKTVRFIPDFSRKFHIKCDASEKGIGGYLYQIREGKETPIMFFSKGFTGTQERWSTLDKEAFAVIFSITKCQEYLKGTRFTIHTDHKPLLWLAKGAKKGDCSSRVFRWSFLLMPYQFDIVHVSGRKNVIADTLSRVEHEEKTEKTEIKEQREAVNSIYTIVEDKFKGDAFLEIAKLTLRKEELTGDLNKPVFAPVRNSVKRNINNLVLEDDILMFRDPKLNDKQNKKKRFYIPVEKRESILFTCHDSPAAGHLGIQATINRIKPLAWWPGLTEDITSYINNCGICQRNKWRRTIGTEIHPLTVCAPFERLHLDLMGPMPVSENENKWIMNCVDSGTKFMISTGIKNKKAETVAKAIVEEVILKYGTPISIVSDQGKEFVNTLNEKLRNFLGISARTTSPYHPASNGQVERYNGTLTQILRTITEPGQKNWDECLKFANWAFNTAKQSGRRYSPFFLMFGREPRSILDVQIGTIPEKMSRMEWFERLRLARESSAALEGKVKSSWKEKREPVKLKGKTNLKEGDKVLVQFKTTPKGLVRKLQAKQQGPYIVKKIEENSAILENCKEKEDVITRNLSQLVIFKGNDKEGDHEYEVEKILDEKEEGNKKFFKIRWRGLGPTFDSWEPEGNLENCKDILTNWNNKNKKEGKKKKRGRKKRISKKMTIHRIVKQGEKGNFLVEVEENTGPDHYKWMSKELILNLEEVLDRFDKGKEEKERKDML